MRLRLGQVFADAGEIWRADRDLLIRVAGVFFFLPLLALRLFLPIADVTGLTDEARQAVEFAWIGRNGLWLAAQAVVQIAGSAAVLALLLDARRPALDEAIGRALRLLPSLLVAWACAFAMIAVGALLIVPAVYLLGRTFLTGALLVAEPGRGPFGALVEGIRRTRNHGWMLASVSLTVALTNYLLASVADSGAMQLQPFGPIAVLPAEIALAAAGAGATLATVLLQAAAYQALTGARQGI